MASCRIYPDVYITRCWTNVVGIRWYIEQISRHKLKTSVRLELLSQKSKSVKLPEILVENESSTNPQPPKSKKIWPRRKAFSSETKNRLQLIFYVYFPVVFLLLKKAIIDRAVHRRHNSSKQRERKIEEKIEEMSKTEQKAKSSVSKKLRTKR